MKRSMKVLSIFMLCIASYTNAAENNAVMLEKVSAPLAGMENIIGADNLAQAKGMMGDEGKAKSYRHCIQNISGYKVFFKRMVKEMVEESTEDGQYNDIKSVTFIEKCPLPAKGQCDHGNRIEYFYTDSATVLEVQKEGCKYFKKIWSPSDVVKH